MIITVASDVFSKASDHLPDLHCMQLYKAVGGPLAISRHYHLTSRGLHFHDQVVVGKQVLSLHDHRGTNRCNTKKHMMLALPSQ